MYGIALCYRIVLCYEVDCETKRIQGSDEQDHECCDILKCTKKKFDVKRCFIKQSQPFKELQAHQWNDERDNDSQS